MKFTALQDLSYIFFPQQKNLRQLCDSHQTVSELSLKYPQLALMSKGSFGISAHTEFANFDVFAFPLINSLKQKQLRLNKPTNIFTSSDEESPLTVGLRGKNEGRTRYTKRKNDEIYSRKKEKKKFPKHKKVESAASGAEREA